MNFKAASHNQQCVYNSQPVTEYFRIHGGWGCVGGGNQVFQGLLLHLPRILSSEYLLGFDK